MGQFPPDYRSVSIYYAWAIDGGESVRLWTSSGCNPEVHIEKYAHYDTGWLLSRCMLLHFHIIWLVKVI